MPVETALTAFSASTVKSLYGVLSLLFSYSAKLSPLKIAFCTLLLPYLSKKVPFSLYGKVSITFSVFPLYCGMLSFEIA